jgi:hypothetical protein
MKRQGDITSLKKSLITHYLNPKYGNGLNTTCSIKKPSLKNNQ